MIDVEQQDRAIRKQQLDGERYFLSLCEEGLRRGLLSESDRECFLMGCRSILSRKTGAYVHGNTVDANSDTARALLESVYYTVGVELKSMPRPEDAIEALLTLPMEDLYLSGQVKIREKLRAAHLMQRHLKKMLFRTESQSYNNTAKRKLDDFFRLYRPASFAQQIHVTVEYPTCPPLEGLVGVEYIEALLRRLALENRFLCYFSPEAVDALLSRENPDYRSAVMNIYKPVLRAALGCVLTGSPVESLEYDRARFAEILAGESAAEQLSDALDRVAVHFDCHPDLRAYLAAGIRLI